MKLPQLFFGTNLKMYQTASETAAFLGELAQLTADLREEPVVRFVIPSFPSLPAAGAVERNGIRLGAQNMHWENAGQYTGEVSPLMLRDLGCIDLVEIGHSERRQLFGETNQQCNQKVLSALANGFTALLCVGETAAEKYYSISDETLAIQLKVGLADVSPAEIAAGRVWIAYEPVWAIGVNGKPAPRLCTGTPSAPAPAASGALSRTVLQRAAALRRQRQLRKCQRLHRPRRCRRPFCWPRRLERLCL